MGASVRCCTLPLRRSSSGPPERGWLVHAIDSWGRLEISGMVITMSRWLAPERRVAGGDAGAATVRAGDGPGPPGVGGRMRYAQERPYVIRRLRG